MNCHNCLRWLRKHRLFRNEELWRKSKGRRSISYIFKSKKKKPPIRNLKLSTWPLNKLLSSWRIRKKRRLRLFLKRLLSVWSLAMDLPTTARSFRCFHFSLGLTLLTRSHLGLEKTLLTKTLAVAVELSTTGKALNKVWLRKKLWRMNHL